MQAPAVAALWQCTALLSPQTVLTARVRSITVGKQELIPTSGRTEGKAR
jgi:hypothetical protein